MDDKSDLIKKLEEANQAKSSAIGDDPRSFKNSSAPARASGSPMPPPPPPPKNDPTGPLTPFSFTLKMKYLPHNIVKSMHVKSIKVTIGQLILGLQAHLRSVRIETSHLRLGCKRHQQSGYYEGTTTVAELNLPEGTVLDVEPLNVTESTNQREQTVDAAATTPTVGAQSTSVQGAVPPEHEEPRPNVPGGQSSQQDSSPSDGTYPSSKELSPLPPRSPTAPKDQLVVCDPPGSRPQNKEADITSTEYNIKLPEDWGALTVWYEALPVRPKEPEPDKDLRLIFRMGESWGDLKKQSTSQAATTPTVEAMIPTAPVLPKVTELQQVDRISANEQTTTQYVKVNWPEWKYVRGPTDPTPYPAEPTPPMPVDPTVREMIEGMRRQLDAILARFSNKDVRLVFRMSEPWADIKKQSTSQAATTPTVEAMVPTAPVLPKVTELQKVDRISANEQTQYVKVLARVEIRARSNRSYTKPGRA